jgi:chromosome segregation ATPase
MKHTETDTIYEVYDGPSSITAGLILKVVKYLEKQDRTHPANQRGVPTKMQSIERQMAQIDDQIKQLTGEPANVTSQGAFDKNVEEIGKLIDKKHALEKEVLAVSQAVFLNKLEKQIQTNSVQEDSYDEPASDYESEMLDNQMAFIKYAADEIKDHVHKGGIFPEWFQNKLSGVHDKMKSLHAYMEGERQQAMDKKRMMSMKDAQDDYFESLERKLNESKGLCKECGKPSYTTLPEEKQKGVDGKVCWKGYKRMGTKKKNGKTVDNCVKM